MVTSVHLGEKDRDLYQHKVTLQHLLKSSDIRNIKNREKFKTADVLNSVCSLDNCNMGRKQAAF